MFLPVWGGVAHAQDEQSDALPPLSDLFEAALPPGRPPPFVFQTARGRDITLEAFRGKPVILHVWASWCPICVAEMPKIDALQAALAPDDIRIVAVNTDHDGQSVAPHFYRVHGLKALDVYTASADQVLARLGVTALPATFLIGADGRLLGRIPGAAEWAEPRNVAWLKALFTKQSAPSGGLGGAGA